MKSPCLPLLIFLLTVLLLSGAVVKGQGSDEEAGVSYDLAIRRARTIRDITYQLHFTLPEQRTGSVITEETIDFDLSDTEHPVYIDFKKEGSDLDSMTVNGRRLALRYGHEHIMLTTDMIHTGKNTVSVKFSSVSQPLNRNNDFLYTLLVPDRARTLFPCFDQPDCKAVYDLTLTMPSGWKAIANGPLKDSAVDGAQKTFRFTPSDRISTYLFAFAAGRFEEAGQVVDGRPMHFLYRETDTSKLRLSIDPIFRIQGDALTFLKAYTGIAYPFRKFDFAAIPDFQFGGMEHPGAIQYKASSLFLSEGATRDQLLGRANLLSHETAHMWFGDLVTMRWFNDVWMKEVFANFMADKISAVTMPDDKSDLKFVTAHYPAAYSTDRTGGAHPIRQELSNLQDAGSMYGNIIYHKAPIVMRQLERLMGADAFRDGLREYLQQYRGGNASWPELIACLGHHTTADLRAWDLVWVNQPGRPVFSYTLSVKKGRIEQLTIDQRGEDGSARIWPQSFGLTLVYPDRTEPVNVNMNAARIGLAAIKGRPAPSYIVFNSDGMGYGIFPVDSHSLTHVASFDALTRASIYVNLYENMLNGSAIDARGLLRLELGALAGEHEELVLNILADHIHSIFWRWLPLTGREPLDDKIWQAMSAERPANEKKILFRLFGNIASTQEGAERLYQVWKTQTPPAGVKLEEDDYTGIAAALVLRNDPRQAAILEEQGNRIRNKDRKERWTWLLPALSNDAAVREAWFSSLEQAANRKKEAWVLTGLSYLHHPLRVGVSEKYLPRTLDLLEEVQRTGDVFFPQGWLGASLAWYRTPTAAAVVRGFLDKHPGYNAKLHSKILQTADNLFRAAALAK